MLNVDMELMRLQARDHDAIKAYDVILRKMDAVVLAAISGGHTVQGAKRIADELYGADKASAYSRLQKTGKDVADYRQRAADKASQRLGVFARVREWFAGDFP